MLAVDLGEQEKLFKPVRCFYVARVSMCCDVTLR